MKTVDQFALLIVRSVFSFFSFAYFFWISDLYYNDSNKQLSVLFFIEFVLALGLIFKFYNILFGSPYDFSLMLLSLCLLIVAIITVLYPKFGNYISNPILIYLAIPKLIISLVFAVSYYLNYREIWISQP